ncbi:MAG: S8 family serine peptidase [Caldilineaceae bacterium]
MAAATRAQLATVEAEQQQVLAALSDVGAQVLYRVQRVQRGRAARGRRPDLDAGRAAPCAAVHAMTPKTPSNSVSVPFIGAPALWSGPAGQSYTGAGLTIAVIDTGVDYLHAAFGGSRRYADNGPTVIGDVPDFPGPKVIAGYDFAGDAYDADPDNSTYNPIPAPDPDPTDCYGHGTHVAATAAGFGVLDDGSGGFGGTFTGPYDAGVRTQSFLIGPGVAPQASIIALKIFGCHGSSDLTELAIDWAVDPNGDGDFADKVDVINMSIGSPYGTTDDPSVVASDNGAGRGHRGGVRGQ